MKHPLGAVRPVRMLVAFALLMATALTAAPASAAPKQGSIVVDARNGNVLYASRADLVQTPASLTKMMTVFMTFEALRDGKLRLDQRVTVSPHAARQPSSKIGFRSGQRVRVRDLIRAAAVRSANDAAVVLAEAIGQTESQFAQMMTQRARQMGMRSTTFKNASGLTMRGHVSSPRDMALLARHLMYDFPQYYNIFGRKSTTAFGRRINNTNRLLHSYSGADGLKTGYTRAAGFSLAASATRGQERIIAVHFGGRSSSARNREVARLLDIGFDRAAPRVAVVKPGVVMSPMPVPNPRRERTPALVAGLREIGTALAPAVAHAATPDPVQRPQALAGNVPRSMMPVPAPNRGPVVEPGWTVDLGAFTRREMAVATLAMAAFGDVPGLAEAGREVAELDGPGDAQRFAARFTGLDGVTALTTCAVLSVDGQPCTPNPPEQGGP